MAKYDNIKQHTFTSTGEKNVKLLINDSTEIPASLFRSCTSLTSIKIPNYVTSIG